MIDPQPLTGGPKHHFFGYYGVNVWDSSGRHHLCLETDFHRRPPAPEDSAAVGLVDTQTGEFVRYAETRAFNLQQGSMLHWIDVGHGEEFTFNAWEGDRLLSRAVEWKTRTTRVIEGAIAAVSPDGCQAMGLDYGRMYHCRSVVGYANTMDPESLPVAPEDDGLFRLDLSGGPARLVVSIAHVMRTAGVTPEGRAWFNHVMYNTDGSRLLFFCRVRTAAGHRSSLWTVNPDGSELAMQIGFDHWISHFAWHDPSHILISTDRSGKRQFLYFEDRSGRFDPIGEGVLPDDGHACFSPDGKWIACDTYPRGKGHASTVMLYNVKRGDATTVAEFPSEPIFTGDIRCDLHPRWTRDGTAVTVDAVPDGTRQVYRIEVGDIVAGG